MTYLPHPQHLLDGAAVGAGDLAILAEAAPTLRRLLLQVVAPHRRPAQDLAFRRHLELLADELEPLVVAGSDQPLTLQRGFGVLGDRAERDRVVDGEIGEHLPVELDPGLRTPMHELVVRQPVRAGGGVDPG